MKEIRLEAKTDNLDKVLEFVEQQMQQVDCPPKTLAMINISVEEIFVNVAHYAYEGGDGDVTVSVDFKDNPSMVEIVMSDEGAFFDPLAKQDPDIHLSAQERVLGGLGIFMVKQSMDDVIYEYRDGKNILTLQKRL